MDGEYASHVRTTLLDAVQQSSGQVHIKALAPEQDPTTWMTLPKAIVRQMAAVVRGEGEDKAFPYNFMGGRVVMAARLPKLPTMARHQGIIIREYEEVGERLFSVHYIYAQRTADEWDGQQGKYGIKTMEKAHDVFLERLQHTANGFFR